MSYDHKIKIESAKAFSGYITKISKKLWPRKKYHASAYSFRHAKATELKNSDYDKIEIAQIMGHASVRSQQSYGRKSKKKKVDLMTSQMSKPMLNPVAVIDYWDLRSQIKTKQRQKLPILPPPAVLHRLPFVASKCEPWAVQEVPSWTVKG